MILETVWTTVIIIFLKSISKKMQSQVLRYVAWHISIDILWTNWTMTCNESSGDGLLSVLS